ncbi:hypothetical protein TNCV_1929811 [Trichonephila clavipes]|nr:hypothetical protein TNCV_1929811 [Trichonephila clavipes]
MRPSGIYFSDPCFILRIVFALHSSSASQAPLEDPALFPYHDSAYTGGSTTHPSSFFIGRPTKVCTWPADSLVSLWWGPNNGSLVLLETTGDKKLVQTSGHFPTRHHSLFAAILLLSSEVSVSSVRQNPSIVIQFDTVMSIMTCRQTADQEHLTKDLVTLNHGQITGTACKLEPLSPNFHTTPMGGRLSLDRFNLL